MVMKLCLLLLTSGRLLALPAAGTSFSCQAASPQVGTRVGEPGASATAHDCSMSQSPCDRQRIPPSASISENGSRSRVWVESTQHKGMSIPTWSPQQTNKGRIPTSLLSAQGNFSSVQGLAKGGPPGPCSANVGTMGMAQTWPRPELTALRERGVGMASRFRIIARCCLGLLRVTTCGRPSR